MTSNPHRPHDFREIQTSITDYPSTSSAINISNNNNNNNNNKDYKTSTPEYTNFQQSLIQKLNAIQYKNMNGNVQTTNTQGIMDYEEYSLNQSAAEVLTDNGILALHVLSNLKNPNLIRQKMKRYLSKINPEE